jgi:hypothetical protein
MKLKLFHVRFAWNEPGRTHTTDVDIWTATKAAARESAETFRREDPNIPNDATITVSAAPANY